MKLSKKTLAIVGAALTSISTMSTSQAREFGDIYTQCGLGAMIFPNHNVMAAISNVTWDLGTTAVSSNASSEENCKGGKVAAAAFINSSYATLEQDIAKGEGQHLSALMDIMNCDVSARAGVVDTLRADFSTAASAQGYAESSHFDKSKTLYNIMKSDKVVSSCGV